jgi:hypothetical protein
MKDSVNEKYEKSKSIASTKKSDKLFTFTDENVSKNNYDSARSYNVI